MKQFNLYDLIAVIAPGAVLVIGMANISPDFAEILGSKELSLGEFGLMLIASYAAGNLLGPVAHFVESVWFRLNGGNHTDRVHAKNTKVLHRSEIEALNDKLKTTSILRPGEDLRDISLGHWRAVVKQIRSFLATRGPSERIEIFNAHYGLNRGLAAAFTVLLFTVVLTIGFSAWQLILSLGVGIILAIYRMNNFGHNYSTELIRQFLHSNVKQKTEN